MPVNFNVDFFIKHFIYVACLCIHVGTIACVWRSEGNLWEAVQWIHIVNYRTWTQVTWFGSLHLYLLSHLSSSVAMFLFLPVLPLLTEDKAFGKAHSQYSTNFRWQKLDNSSPKSWNSSSIFNKARAEHRCSLMMFY